MKPFEIALFKHFIDSKGMTTVFINLYRKHHIKTNPSSIEEFFTVVDAKEVCTEAFYFVINERWGHDYWTQTQNEWEEFLATNNNDYAANEWWKMQGIAKILRYNWDAAKHWKMENRLTAAIRLGIDLSLLGIDENKDNPAPPTEMSKEYLREKGLEVTNDDDDDDVEINGDGLEMDILGDFIDVDIKTHVHDKRRLKNDEISINTRNDTYRITFNQDISNDIKARGGYEYAALLCNKQGDVIIKLNDEKGVSVQDGNKTRKNANVIIHSQEFVLKLMNLLSINGDYTKANVKEVAKNDDFVAYLVTKK